MRIEEWREEVGKYFLEYLLAAEVGVSVICQLLIEDITNPFCLVYVDVPSSGKTITLNFFNELKELVYYTDNFSAAAFVSHAANVKKKDLSKVDLLPRIRHKVLIVRDLAPIFGMRDDDILKTMGILTRVCDGEGLITDGGVHGSRGYEGDYLFMFLAASTPIRPRIWKVMGNFGSRLFFLNMNTMDKSIDVLAKQLSSKLTPKVKEKYCSDATKALIDTIWARNDAFYWDKDGDDPQLLEEIARIAQLVACLRGTINVWKENLGDESFNHTTAQIEKPDRINQLFYNLARGHAVACGREKLIDEDIAIVLKVALSSASMERSKFMNELIKKEGVLTTEDVIDSMDWSRPTALKLMEIFRHLKIVQEVEAVNLSVGRSEKVIKLTNKFSWFIGNRFKELVRYTVSDSVYKSINKPKMTVSNCAS